MKGKSFHGKLTRTAYVLCAHEKPMMLKKLVTISLSIAKVTLEEALENKQAINIHCSGQINGQHIYRL